MDKMIQQYIKSEEFNTDFKRFIILFRKLPIKGSGYETGCNSIEDLTNHAGRTRWSDTTWIAAFILGFMVCFKILRSVSGGNLSCKIEIPEEEISKAEVSIPRPDFSALADDLRVERLRMEFLRRMADLR